MNKDETRISAAVVHIGAGAARLKISEFVKGKVVPLEQLSLPLNVGHDVFHDGHIDFTTVKEIGRALNGFQKIIREYGVTEVRTVAASALREADNRAMVTDRLKAMTGIDNIDVLENSVEKPLIYHSCLRALTEAKIELKGKTLFAFVGSGTIGLSLAEGRQTVWSQNLPFGALKIGDTIAQIKENATEAEETARRELLNALLSGQTAFYANVGYFDLSDVDNIILAGSNADFIAQITKAKKMGSVYRPTKLAVTSAKERLSAHGVKMTENQENLLFSVLAIYGELIRRTNPKEIYILTETLLDGIMEQMLVPGAKKNFRSEVADNAVSCAEHMAKAFLCDKAHNEFVGALALNMFDKLKKLHGLGKDERLVLHIAAILTGCGRLISARGNLEASYDIMRRTEIYGITNRSRLYIANLLRYSAFAAPDLNDEAWRELTNKEQTTLAKLAAIYRLALALDASGKQKISADKISVKEDGDNVVISAPAPENGDFTLERYIVGTCVKFFRAVYGLTPVLKIKRSIGG